MPKTSDSKRLEDAILKKKGQLKKLETRISPLIKRKQKLTSDIRSLESAQAQAHYSQILGVIKGIDGIDQLSSNEIKEALIRATKAEKQTESDARGEVL